MEAVLSRELQGPRISAKSVEIGTAGVSFRGSLETGIRAVMWSRSAHRILLKEVSVSAR